MLYRIFTESTGEMRERAIDCVVREFDQFTVIDTTGYWNGKREDSMIIEIAAEARDRDYVLTVAANIRHANNQEAVAVQTIDGTFECI